MSQKKSEKRSATLSQSCNTSTSIASKISAQVGADIGSSQTVQKRPRLSDVNAELTCILCSGYFIDATTISECLHSFCKSCIVKYLETNKCCPICETQVHGTKPLLSIRSDKILQDIVYKLIPDVFKNEMKRRRDFYATHPEAVSTSAEDRGEVVDHRIFYMSNDEISLSLEYGYGENQIPENGYQSTDGTPQSDEANESEGMKRYLLCPSLLSIATLKKFIARKYGLLTTTYNVDIMYLEDILSEDYTLMDVAYIYAWRRSDPMRLFYRISERPIKRMKTTHPQTVDTKSGNGSGVNTNNSKDMSDVSNKSSSGVSNQSKLVHTQASSCTSRTTASTIIMTGAAQAQTIKAHNSSNKSNNSGVTSGKASNATPRRADPSKSASTMSQAVNTQPTPPGILKSKSVHKSASSVQTDEPPKKLRKILPANNSSVSTPKPVPTDCFNANTSSPVIPLTPLTTSSSTVNSLRQCRINSDKSKLCSTVSSIGCNTSQNVNQNLGLSASNCSTKSEPKSDININVKKNSGKKCSAFDVRTLIGTKSPTLHCNRHSVESMSGNQCIECNEEKAVKEKNSSSDCKSGSQTSKQSKGSAREVNRNKLTSSQSSMPSTLSSMTTGSTQNKKLAMSWPSVESVRPPTNKSIASNNRVATPDKPDSSPSMDRMPSKQSKSVTNVSSKQLNAKSLKSSQNETTVKTCYTNKDITTDNTNTKISVKPMSGTKSDTKSDTPQHQSTPLSPTSIRIKLPPLINTNNNNNNKNSCKSSAANCKVSPSSTSLVSSHHNNKETNHLVDSFLSKSDSKKQCLDNKTSETGQKSIGNIGNICNQSLSKSSISQSSSKTKGASINQIVSKIASGVTAKSASVNVTSTTPTLDLKTKSNTNVPQLSSGSNEVTPNELNDNKVSTTTTDSSVGSAIHKSESAIKSVSAVTSAATNSGNLVIRISTKTHSVESLVSPKDREKKFEIKRDSNNSSDNSSKTNNSSNSHIDGKNEDKKHKNEKEIKSSVNNPEEDDEEEEEDDDIDGKLVVDVPNDDSCERDMTNTNAEVNRIVDNKERAVIKAGDNSSKSSPSNALSVKSTKVADISTKLAINISTAHQLSANSAVLASPPPTPTPSPKSESDTITDNKSNSSSPSNGPLDLSMSTKKDRNLKTSISPVPIRAIYDIPPPKPKHCVNPAVLDKHRGQFPAASAPKQQYQSFKIMSSQSQGIRQSSGVSSIHSTSTPAPTFEISKKNRSVGSPIVSSNTTTGSNSSNNSRHRSLSNNNHSHHHNSHHNHKTYSVITPDPHRYTPKLVIRNIGSPPSITSHFNYPTHH